MCSLMNLTSAICFWRTLAVTITMFDIDGRSYYSERSVSGNRYNPSFVNLRICAAPDYNEPQYTQFSGKAKATIKKYSGVHQVSRVQRL